MPKPTLAGSFVYTNLVDLANEDSIDMAVDGSETPVHFDHLAGAVCHISRVLFLIRDTAIKPEQFAGVDALANGCMVQVLDVDGSTPILDFLDGSTIQTHHDFALLAGSDVLVQPGVNADVITVRWTIAKAGAPLQLLTGQRIRFTVNDDLSPISAFNCRVQGVYRT